MKSASGCAPSPSSSSSFVLSFSSSTVIQTRAGMLSCAVGFEALRSTSCIKQQVSGPVSCFWKTWGEIAALGPLQVNLHLQVLAYNQQGFTVYQQQHRFPSMLLEQSNSNKILYFYTGTTCFATDTSTVVCWKQKHTWIFVFFRTTGSIQRSTGKFPLLLQVSDFFTFIF